MSFDFMGKGVLVTGAAAGIGLATARAFAEAGAAVMLTDVNGARLREAHGELARRGLKVFLCGGDVRERGDTRTMVDQTVQHCGQLDVLVNNAGIYPNRLVLEMGEEEWDRVMDTNAKGTFLMSQRGAAQMVRQGRGGKIINLASGAAESGRRGAAHYCASKAAIVMLTRVLALELAPHKINVNAVSPGFIDVGPHQSVSEEYRRAITGGIPWGRAGTPDDIAQAILFLASAEAEFITGTVLRVDGGSSAGRWNLPVS